MARGGSTRWLEVARDGLLVTFWWTAGWDGELLTGGGELVADHPTPPALAEVRSLRSLRVRLRPLTSLAVRQAAEQTRLAPIVHRQQPVHEHARRVPHAQLLALATGARRADTAPAAAEGRGGRLAAERETHAVLARRGRAA